MCSRPKSVQVEKQADKDLPVLRNPYTDGASSLQISRRHGLKALRIDRGSTQTPTKPTPSPGGSGDIEYGRPFDLNALTPDEARGYLMTQQMAGKSLIGRALFEKGKANIYAKYGFKA